MAIYVPWLSDAARLTGYPVVELAGWRERGHGGMTSVEGVVCHHTAGPKTGEYPSLAVVRDGRAGLAGPLANFGLGRSGTVYVNAAGTAWHAGTSAWAGMTDLNSRFLGIEAEDDGDGVWTDAQRDAYPRLCAALCHYMRRDASRVCAHRECATPAGRKPDPTGIDMVAFRGRVGQLLVNPLQLIPLGAAAPTTPEGLFMALTAAEEKDILEAARSVLFGQAGVRSAGRMATAISDLYTAVGGVNQRLDALAARPAAQVDTAPIVAAVIDAVARAGVAQQVLDGLAARLSAKPAA